VQGFSFFAQTRIRRCLGCWRGSYWPTWMLVLTFEPEEPTHAMQTQQRLAASWLDMVVRKREKSGTG
jgi:hypothetical protein